MRRRKCLSVDAPWRENPWKLCANPLGKQTFLSQNGSSESISFDDIQNRRQTEECDLHGDKINRPGRTLYTGNFDVAKHCSLENTTIIHLSSILTRDINPKSTTQTPSSVRTKARTFYWGWFENSMDIHWGIYPGIGINDLTGDLLEIGTHYLHWGLW